MNRSQFFRALVPGVVLCPQNGPPPTTDKAISPPLRILSSRTRRVKDARMHADTLTAVAETLTYW